MVEGEQLMGFIHETAEGGFSPPRVLEGVGTGRI